MAPRLHLSRARLTENITAVRARIAPSEILIALKDDAYGHGLEWAVRGARAAGVEWYGSYDIASGLRVRAELGAEGRVFAWVTSWPDEVREAIAADIDLGVGTQEYLRLVIAQAQHLGRTARVHLKADTGLHRNGVRPEDWPAFITEARAAERAGLVRIVGVWSHLSEASDADDDRAHGEFLRSVELLRETGPEPEAIHLTASAASWWRPELRGSVSRIGAFCYGIRSADGPDLPGILPVAALSAAVVGMTTAGAEIGIGRLDGLPSILAGAEAGTPGGARRLLRVGTATSVVAPWPGARVGDDVWIFGPGAHGEPSATTLAERIDTVGEEILTRLTARVERVEED